MVWHSLSSYYLYTRMIGRHCLPYGHHPLPQFRIHTAWFILCSIIGICTSRYIAKDGGIASSVDGYKEIALAVIGESIAAQSIWKSGLILLYLG